MMNNTTWVKIPKFPGYLINIDGVVKYEATGTTIESDLDHPDSVMMHDPKRHRPALVPISDLLVMAFPLAPKEQPVELRYHLAASRSHSGINGDYATLDDAINRLKDYELSFPGELVTAMITKNSVAPRPYFS